MFNVSHLDKKYHYNYALKESVLGVFSIKHLNKKNPFEVVNFINLFIKSNQWEWDSITYYNCKRIEFLIQEKLPSKITDKKEIYYWLVNNWKRFYFSSFNNISLN